MLLVQIEIGWGGFDLFIFLGLNLRLFSDVLFDVIG
jgi:hypothetical protein